MMQAIQVLAEQNGKTTILLPNGSADPRRIALTVMKAANVNPKMGTRDEHAKLAESILAAATALSMYELNGVKFLFAIKEQKKAKATPELATVKLVEVKPAENVQTKVMVAKPETITVAVAPEVCIACQGTGKNTRNQVCVPCNGTGKKQITAVGGQVGVQIEVKVAETVAKTAGNAVKPPAGSVPELLQCGICHNSLMNGITTMVQTEQHGCVHRECLEKIVKVKVMANNEESRQHHESFMRNRIGELDRLFDNAVAKEVARRKLGAAATVDILQPYTSPKGAEECFLCQNRLNPEARGTITSNVQSNDEKIYVHRHCLLHAVETDPTRNALVTYEAWGLRLQGREIEDIMQMHASVQESIAEIIRAKMKEVPMQIKVLHTERPIETVETVQVDTNALEAMPSAAMLGLAPAFKASANRVYAKFNEMGIMPVVPKNEQQQAVTPAVSDIDAIILASFAKK